MKFLKVSQNCFKGIPNLSQNCRGHPKTLPKKSPNFSKLLPKLSQNPLNNVHKHPDSLKQFGLCTLPSSEPRTSARSETWPGSALPEVLMRPILVKCYLFQHFYWHHGPGAGLFTRNLKRRAPTAAALLVRIEMIACETQECRRSTFLANVSLCRNKRLDFIDSAFR